PSPACDNLTGGFVPKSEDQIQRQSYSELLPQAPRLPAVPDPDVQRKRMLIALAVLLVALVAVVLKDWDFWFPSTDDAQELAAPRKTAVAAPSPIRKATAAPTKNEKRSV